MKVLSLPLADWSKALLRSEGGAIKPILANAIATLREAPEWRCVLSHDVFAMTTMATAAPPWEFDPNNWTPRHWTSHDDLLTAEWLQRNGVVVTAGVAAQAVEAVARERWCHPVQDYLDSLKWDGRVRLDSWLWDFLGADDNTYNSNVGRHALIAAVARVRCPGCKVDTIPIIEGPQGLGKSSALRALFDPWFSDDLAELGSKDAAMQTRGAWLIEISELDAMSRSETSRIKAFASRTTDRFRPPYGSRIIESPRSCVFWGTTNSDTYLKDETGGRRFWPIKAKKIDLKGLDKARDQLWAEAQALYARDVVWWLVNPEAKEQAKGEQLARYVGDPWDAAISSYLASINDVSIDEILVDVIHLDRSRWTQVEMNRVARCLRSIGWIRYQARTGDKRAWRYRRGAAS
jgi:predicted P-loop ATPase